MTHKELILEAFHRSGGSMSLGFILQHPWGYEFRARVTELRRQGFVIVCEKAKRPSDNVYRLLESQPGLFGEAA
jgi:hypothetical protein